VTRGSPGGDDHRIGDVRLAAQIDGDDVFGLVVIELGLNERKRRGGAFVRGDVGERFGFGFARADGLRFRRAGGRDEGERRPLRARRSMVGRQNEFSSSPRDRAPASSI
jgi:hypothetical protein